MLVALAHHFLATVVRAAQTLQRYADLRLKSVNAEVSCLYAARATLVLLAAPKQCVHTRMVDSLEGSCGCLPQPPLESVGFNRTEALRVLGFCAAAQCSTASIQTWNCTACPQSTPLSDVRVIENNSHLAFVAYDPDPDAIVVVLRGSLSIRDWLNNLNYFKTIAYGNLGCSKCHVHRGFLEAFQALEGGILSSLKTLQSKHPHSAVIVTGHSLGAAMAAHTAIALKLIHNISNIRTPIYTFGQPRVGDAAFASWFHGHFPHWLRSVHWNDPVPHLAPESFGFKHVGREIWWSEDSSAAIVGDGSGEYEYGSHSIVAALVFTDHWYYLGEKCVQCSPLKNVFFSTHYT